MAQHAEGSLHLAIAWALQGACVGSRAGIVYWEHHSVCCISGTRQRKMTQDWTQDTPSPLRTLPGCILVTQGCWTAEATAVFRLLTNAAAVLSYLRGLQCKDIV